MGNQEKDLATYKIMKYRRGIPSRYQNLVFAKWMRSYRHGNDYVKLANPDCYFEAYNRYITNILYRPDTILRLAVLSDEDDVVLGFSVIERDVLHYVLVGKDFRKQGIAKQLVPTEINWITHLTKIGLRLWAKELPQAQFNPFL